MATNDSAMSAQLVEEFIADSDARALALIPRLQAVEVKLTDPAYLRGWLDDLEAGEVKELSPLELRDRRSEVISGRLAQLEMNLHDPEWLRGRIAHLEAGS